MKRSPKVFRTSFNSLFRNRKISAPSVDRTAPQCYNKVILKKRKREVIYYENPEKLLDLLAQDARLTPAQLAAMLGESEEDVAAAIKAYEKNSTILGYKTVVDWDKTSKESVTALIEVKITPQKGMGFDEIARQIYSHHQVESVYLMSGGFDLTVIIKGRTMREVARFVSEQLAPMENVLSTGTHFILKKYKDNSVEFDPADSDKREVMAW